MDMKTESYNTDECRQVDLDDLLVTGDDLAAAIDPRLLSERLEGFYMRAYLEAHEVAEEVRNMTKKDRDDLYQMLDEYVKFYVRTSGVSMFRRPRRFTSELVQLMGVMFDRVQEGSKVPYTAILDEVYGRMPLTVLEPATMKSFSGIKTPEDMELALDGRPVDLYLERSVYSHLISIRNDQLPAYVAKVVVIVG